MHGSGCAQQRRNPSAYVPTDDLFTADRQQIYGVLLDDKGARYGVEINGPRKAAWGAPQSREFQTTPAFTALRRDATLTSAIAGAPYPAQQMVFWMRELSEIAVLDHIFSQQDRVAISTTSGAGIGWMAMAKCSTTRCTQRYPVPT